MFKKVVFVFSLLLSSLFADVSLGVIGNHAYIEFDTIDEFNEDQGENWVAIYKKGASVEWENVIQWALDQRSSSSS